jgi:hypothetical protein
VAPDVLVFFVAGPVDDAVAAVVRRRVTDLARSRDWSVRAPGFFDDPGAADAASRTTGCYLSGGAADEIVLVWEAAVATSAELGAVLEVQWREVILGSVRAGVPDPGLEGAVRAARDSVDAA